MKFEVVTITTAATLIARGAGTSVTQPRACTIRNPNAAAVTVYLGPSGMTTADSAATGGWPLDSSFPSVDLVLDPSDAVYGIVAASTQDIYVLRNGE